jgi:hypothetical protein
MQSSKREIDICGDQSLSWPNPTAFRQRPTTIRSVGGLLRDLDPEEARTITDPALKLMMGAVNRYDGYVVQSTGDGIFALFGAPVAHEDHPQRALHAAIATRDELRRRGEDLQMQGRTEVEVRIGINTGEVVMRMSRPEDTLSTRRWVTRLTWRHACRAWRRQAGWSSAKRRGVWSRAISSSGPGTDQGQGISGAIDVYEVVGIGALHGHFDLATRRALTKFVGRENELAQMQHASTRD